MPTATVDGIPTRYEVSGDGPPLLMFSPGGFDSTLDNWTEHGLYPRIELMVRLRERFTCIAFDRRESGRSGGRLERIRWEHWVAQAAGLLDHLGVERAHLIGACVGCSTAAAFAVAHPARTARMVLYSPAGGPRYRMTQLARFGAHAAYVASDGLGAVVELARSGTAQFAADPRVGPWVTVLRTDDAFAKEYAATDPVAYGRLVTAMGRLLFDRDTVCGVEPADLMALDTPALIVPGQDASHAPSAARYLQECLAGAEYWDVPVAEQTAGNAPARVIEFLSQQ
jgi:pimeloyl-ACP methyl ester carboxylesterase